jgi:hypothetical protein
MTRTQIARIAAMLKNNIDTAVSQRHLTEADAIARIARNLAVELADISASFRFHSFYAACGLTTDGYRPLDLGTGPC